MQTPVYIPAQAQRPTATRQDNGGYAYGKEWADCTIIAFVGISGIESNHELAGAFTTVHAIAMWPTGELFERDVRELKVRPEDDLTPPEIEIGPGDQAAKVAATEARLERMRREHR